MELRDVLMQYRKKILTLDHVVGVGRGFKEVSGEQTNLESIQVLVEQKLSKSDLRRRAMIPEQIEGFPTDVIAIGRIQALGTRTERMRPAVPGVSIGHYLVSAGTFGAVVYDLETGQPLILSNNHILANISTTGNRRAQRGDPILQPAAYDGGTIENDLIGYLERYVPLNVSGAGGFNSLPRLLHRMSRSLSPHRDPAESGAADLPLGGENAVDCAVAIPADDQYIDYHILSIGSIRGVRMPEIGEKLTKSGRTTGITQGKVRTLDATVSVEMGDGLQAVFYDQMILDLISDGGDSGALVLDHYRNACGLLFAGSTEVTVCNPIQPVLDALRVRF